MACDNTNTGLWLCCGTLRGAEEEEEAAGVTPWSDGHTLGLLSGTKPAVGAGHKQLQPFLLRNISNSHCDWPRDPSCG